MKKVTFKKNNGTYLIVFFILFFAAILVSLIIRGIHLIQTADFTQYMYTLLVVADDSYIVSVNTHDQKLSALHIKDVRLDSKNLLVSSMKAGIPLNGAVVLPADYHIGAIEPDLLSYGKAISVITNGKAKLYHLNEYDLLKFVFLAKQVKNEQKKFAVINNYTHNTEIQQQIKDQLYELFKDSTVINEQVSIEVVNATDTSGIATQVSQMLENAGYTVVAVDSDDAQLSSIHTAVEENESTRNLAKIFRFPQKAKQKVPIADVTVVIGADALQ